MKSKERICVFVMLVNIACIPYVWKKLPQNKCISVYLFTNNSDMFLILFLSILLHLWVFENSPFFSSIFICALYLGIYRKQRNKSISIRIWGGRIVLVFL